MSSYAEKEAMHKLSDSEKKEAARPQKKNHTSIKDNLHVNRNHVKVCRNLVCR